MKDPVITKKTQPKKSKKTLTQKQLKMIKESVEFTWKNYKKDIQLLSKT